MKTQEAAVVWNAKYKSSFNEKFDHIHEPAQNHETQEAIIQNAAKKQVWMFLSTNNNFHTSVHVIVCRTQSVPQF